MLKIGGFMHRASALQSVAVQGRFGADSGAPGVNLSVIHPLSIVMVIARQGKAKALKDVLSTLKKGDVLWAGPDQFYVQAQGLPDGALYADLKNRLAGLALASDQSHGRVVIRISGLKARAVLAKGTPVDLHPQEFSVGKSALTQMAQVSVHFTRTGTDEFTLSVFRGFSESFWEWLTSQAAEFGYQVT
jgi:heterotetrameric sarcosine oxidase gamma subunit